MQTLNKWSNKKRGRIRVAVTGIGMVTPLGLNTLSTWNNLIQQKSGMNHIKSFDASGFSTQIAAEVRDFHPEVFIKNKKILKLTTKPIQFALAAAEEALVDAGIRPNLQTQSRWGLVTGSSMMTTEFNYWMDFHKRFAQQGSVDIHKFGESGLPYSLASDFAKVQANTALGLLAQQHQIFGYTMSVHTACASGGQALGLGMQAIRRGHSDYVLAGGFDSMINPTGLSGFCLLGALSTYNDSPQTASRPFDRSRNGFVLGEGSAFLVLEAWDHAVARGARIYAELAGEGNTLSAYRITDSHPSGDGAIQSMQAAMASANAQLADVSYINAHGTSTLMNDLCESNAIKAVFKERAKAIPISSTKSQLGHLISAAGALEGAICALAIHHKTIPMTANFKQPDPECELDFVGEGPRALPLRVVLSNSLGFGGTNNTLAFANPNWLEEKS